MSTVGRPKGNNNMECAYTFRMDEKTYDRLMAYCKKMNITKSAALRSAIELLPDVIENGGEEFI